MGGVCLKQAGYPLESVSGHFSVARNPKNHVKQVRKGILKINKNQKTNFWDRL
jgi:hypothetical protein